MVVVVEKCLDVSLVNHVVLVHQTQRSAFLTRDLNSAINIRLLAHEWIHNRNRPIAFRRSVDESLHNGTGCPIE